MTRTPFAPLIAAALALTTGACDLALPWSRGAGPAGGGADPVVAHSPKTLDFQGWLQGGSPQAQWFVVSGLPEGVDVSVEFAAPIIYEPKPGTPPVPGRSWQFTAIPPDQVGIGSHTGTISVRAIWRSSRVELSGSPWQIPYRYVVGPAALAPAPLHRTIEQLVGGPAPAPLELLVDGADGAGPWTAKMEWSLNYPPDPWFTISPSGGNGVPARVLVEVTRAPVAGGPDDEAFVVLTRAEQQQRIRVTRPVRHPRLITNEAPVALVMVAGQADLPRFSLQVEAEGGVPVQGIVEVAYGTYPTGGSDYWLAYDWRLGAPQTTTLSLKTTAMAPGHYAASVRLAGPANSVVVPVTLDVLPPPLTVAPTQLALTVNASSRPSSLFVTATVSAGEGPVTFTAAADVPWLSVSPPASTAIPGAPVTLTIQFDKSAMPGMRYGANAGRVVVRPALEATGGVATEFPVEVALQLLLPTVQAVGPADDVEGSRAEVAIIGGGLLGASEVRFGTQPASVVRALSDTSLRAIPPALPPGSYEVTIPTALGASAGVGRYRIHAPARPPAASFAAPGRKARLHVDGAGRFLWAVNAGAEALERYWSGGGWSRAAFAAPWLQDAVPSPFADGRFEVLADTRMQVAEADLLPPDSTLTVPLLDPIPYTTVRSGTDSLVAGLDGHVLLLRSEQGCLEGGWMCEVFPFDPATRTVNWSYQVSGQGDRGGASRSGLRLVVANDGNGLLLLHEWSASTRQDISEELGRWLTHRGVALPGARVLSLDRHGDLVLLVRDGTAGGGGSRLLDGALQLLPGHLPATIAAALLTQGGDVAVAFDGASRTVRRFDLASAPDLATGEFAELGPVGGFAPLDDPGAGVVLALSADDRTLFVGGDDRILVVPLP